MRRSLKRTLFCLSILLAMAAMSGCATRAIGQIQYWPMQEGQRHGTAFPLFYLSGDWTFPAVRLSGTGDIDGDGQEDIVWQHRDGLVQYWKMHDGQHKQTITVDAPVPEEWTLAGVGDLDGDGDDDIVWRIYSGWPTVRRGMNG